MNLALLLRQNLVGKLLNHALVFFINILLVRIFGASQSGFYFNELYILNFIAFFFSLGLDYSAIEWISKNREYVKSIHSIFVKLLILVAIVLLGILFFILFFDIHFSSVQTLYACVLFIIGNLMMILFQGILSALKKFNIQNKILLITNGLYLLLLWGLLFFQFQKIIQVALMGYAILFCIQGSLLLMVSFEKNNDSAVTFSKVSFIKYGGSLMISSLIYFCFIRVDNFFVEYYCNPVVVSNYVQCGKVGQYFIYFSSIVSSTIIPFIASGTMEYKDWVKLVLPYVVVIFIGAFLLAFSGCMLYPFLFGAPFKEMQTYMLIFLPGFVSLSLLTLLNSVYIGKRNIRKIFMGDVLGLVLVLGLDFFIVPLYGALSAALISSGVYCLVFLFLCRGFKNNFTANNKLVS